MLLYLLVFFVPVVFYIVTQRKEGETSLFLLLFMSFLALFVGLGDMLGGYDRYIYGECFDALADDLEMGFPLSKSIIYEQYSDELGYVLFNWVLAHVTANRYIFILVLTIFMYVMIWYNMKKYVSNYSFALVLFMALLFFFTFTYLRQMLGAAIACFSIKYIISRDWKKFFLVMFIAIMFHKSAVIFVPMYFVPIKMYSRNRILLLMLLCLLVGISGASSALFAAYEDVRDLEAHAQYAAQTDGRWAYVIESAFFLYVLLVQHRYMSNDKQSIVLYNISLAFCAVLLFFIRSDNGGRLSWYFMYGLIFTLTNFATSRTGRQLNIHVLLLIVSFVLFLRIDRGWEFNMAPYKTFLTPGHTAAEWIYDQYEYDTTYDIDKLYR